MTAAASGGAGPAAGERTPSGWAESPDHPPGPILPPRCALTSSTSFTPSGATFFLPFLQGEAGLSPRQMAKPGVRSRCPGSPTWHSQNPHPSSFPSPTAGPMLAGDITIASCTPLGCAGHHWHHPRHCPWHCPSRSQLSPLWAAPPRFLGVGGVPGGCNARGCRIKPGRAALGHRWGFGVSRSQRSQLRMGAHRVSTCSHQMSPRDPQPHPSPSRERGGAVGSTYRLQAAHRAPR